MSESPSIFIGMPMNLGAYPVSLVSLIRGIDRLHELKIPHRLAVNYRTSVLPKCRNELIHEFMESGMTHYLSVESDVGFGPHYIETLIESDVDIIGCFETRKNICWENVRLAAREDMSLLDIERHAYTYVAFVDEDKREFAPDKPVESRLITLGLTLIRRRVFEAIRKSSPTFVSENGTLVPEYLRFGITEGGTFHCEAGDLCIKARRLGFKVYAHPMLTTSQMGLYHYTGCFLCTAGVPHTHMGDQTENGPGAEPPPPTTNNGTTKGE